MQAVIDMRHQRSMDLAESATLAQQRGESVVELWREALLDEIMLVEGEAIDE